MGSNKGELIRLLEAELELIESGGYGQPSGHPEAKRPMFDRSLVCINHWQVPDHDADCHDNCILLDAVPKDRRTETLPCHFIPLNPSGDTVHSLEQTADPDELQAKVKEWLRGEIRRLKALSDDEAPDVRY